MHKEMLFALGAICAGAAAAQPPAKPAPADPQARVPAVEYRSAFENYQRYAEPEVSGWREKNEEARRIGGHAGMQRQGGSTKPQAKPPAHGEHK
jgi:hypothetical protein